MGFTPWLKGSLDDWVITLYRLSSTGVQTARNLTGYTAAVYIAPKTGSVPAWVAGTGSAVVTDAVNGVVTYSPGAADVATVRRQLVGVVITSGGKASKFQILEQQIVDAPP